ncbi:MAG: CTP synthase [Verrucomicrobia bacterium GWF2_51_19]|nr:MAG: CTP synthase [Verrucomicrobia bacterium GWF2_51_19]HCJ12294.1 CTP synthetase [Opitutae bacterium]
MKHIFITGGVVSSLGKGLTAASLGALLEGRGYRVSLQKFDPYLNVDPGTMSPFQHGEVYVLEDGAETDLDLGHYERFTHCKLSRANSVSSGQVYAEVLRKERRGDYLGSTVQVIPHVTDQVKKCLGATEEGAYDIVITEIGGTIGDIEGLPILEGLRQFALEKGRENVLFVHVTLIPYLRAAGELKSKPSQQSVARLREIGIQPDILVCRTEKTLDQDLRKKLSLFCNVPERAVIEEKDLECSIYELPLALHAEKLDVLVLEKLGLASNSIDMSEWEKVVNRLKYPEGKVRIALVGKYVELQDAYKSVYESLTHGGIANNCRVEVIRIDAEAIEADGVEAHLSNVNGILVPGGFGNRGTEGKIAAARYAREHDIPYFGICLGMQIAVIEFARNVICLNANSTEFDPKTEHAVIDIMETQKKVEGKGASMRLGAFDCTLKDNTLAHAIYKKHKISERHRHRYELNNTYKQAFETAGLVFSGHNEALNLVEMIENPHNRWFVGVQFHPEFQSKPNAAHPLFESFIAATQKTYEK